MALLPPATHSSSPVVLLPHVFPFQKGPCSPSPFTAPLFFPVFFHPSPSICLFPLPIQLPFFHGTAALFPHQNELTLSLPSLSLSLSLPCFTIHCASLPTRAPSMHKNLPPQLLYIVTYIFIALQLICQLVSLNCLRIYNLARRWVRVCLSFQRKIKYVFVFAVESDMALPARGR